ncbi:MAG: hypothetical protein GDA48_01185 [Hormoscilla sp. GM102CHS1]|nr:hypothetical protein [Hormoscilla sp. GM102CHS1]
MKKRSGTIFIVLLTIGIADTIVRFVLSYLMQPQVWGTDWNGLVYAILTYLISAFFITIRFVFEYRLLARSRNGTILTASTVRAAIEL